MFFHKLRKQTKWIIIFVCIAFALTLLYVGGTGFFGTPQGTVEAVARVNGRDINVLALQQAVLSQVNMYRQFGQEISPVQEEDVRFLALRQLIDQEIMRQAAERERIPVDRAELNARIDEIKEFYGSSFRQVLMREGITERQLRDLLRTEMQMEALRNRESTVQVTDDEVRAEYERSLLELNARHILISPEMVDEDLDWDGALQKAQEVYARLQAGEDFAAVAQEVSDDEVSAIDGGSLGWIRADTPFVPEFLDALFSLEGDSISEPVRSQFGYHLIQVTDRRQVEGEPFEEIKEQLRARLEEVRGMQRFEAWLNQEREKADVAILDPQMRAHQFVQSARYDQAIDQYKQAIEARPFDPYLHYRLANVLERVEAYDEALEAYKEAVELGPTDPQLWFSLGQAYEERGAVDEAVEAYVRTSELSDNIFIHQILEQIFLELDRPDLADAERERIEEIRAAIEEQQRLLQEQVELERQFLEQLQAQQQQAEDEAAEGDSAAEDDDAAAEGDDTKE